MKFVPTPTPTIVANNGGTVSMKAVLGVGPQGPDGPQGPKGDTGAPGGSDASFAGWINTPGSATQGALNASFAAPLMPEKYGAVGDGSTDDTAALQNWVNDVTTGKRLGWLTAGKTYKLTAALDLGPQSDGWTIEGHGAYLLQATDNTPIFKFTHENTHTWRIQGVQFTWANAQPSTNTQAVAIGFQSTTSLSYGFYNCTVHRCSIRKGYAFTMQLAGSSSVCPVWGIDFFDIYVDKDVSGYGINLRQDSSGQPNISIRKFYSRGDVMTGSAISIKGSSVLTLANVEFNQHIGNELTIESCNAVAIAGIKSENAAPTANLGSLWKFNDSGTIVVSAAYFLTTQFNQAGKNLPFIESRGGTRLLVKSLTISNPNLTAGNMFAFYLGTASGASYADIEAYTAPAFVNTFYTFDTPTSASRVRRIGNGTGYIPQTLTAAGAVTVDASLGNTHAITLQANATSLTISNAALGQRLTVMWVQDSTGGRTYAWPTACKFAGGTAPTDTTASKRTSVTFVYDGTNWYETGRSVAVG